MGSLKFSHSLFRCIWFWSGDSSMMFETIFGLAPFSAVLVDDDDTNEGDPNSLTYGPNVVIAGIIVVAMVELKNVSSFIVVRSVVVSHCLNEIFHESQQMLLRLCSSGSKCKMKPVTVKRWKQLLFVHLFTRNYTTEKTHRRWKLLYSSPVWQVWIKFCTTYDNQKILLFGRFRSSQTGDQLYSDTSILM